MTEFSEYISTEVEDMDAWLCICGNQPCADGFYPCDHEGNEMEPVEGWEDLYVCASCGRIIKQDSLEVIGQNPNFSCWTDAKVEPQRYHWLSFLPHAALSASLRPGSGLSP